MEGTILKDSDSKKIGTNSSQESNAFSTKQGDVNHLTGGTPSGILVGGNKNQNNLRKKSVNFPKGVEEDHQMETKKHDKSYLASDALPFTLVFAHGMLFFMQSIVFIAPSAIYYQIFSDVGLISDDDLEKVPVLVGYLTGVFFVGKIISDFMWGIIRDSIGDKKCINLVSVCLIISLLMTGFCFNLWTLLVCSFLLGISSGLFVPGLAFCNWIEPDKRDKLVLLINVFAGAGTMSGPFIGSLLFHIFEEHRMPKAFGAMTVMLAASVIAFNYTFSDIDDSKLINQSEYSRMLEIETERVRHVSQNEDYRPNPRDLENPNSSISENLKFIECRKKLVTLSGLQMLFFEGNSRLLVVIACGITWGVRLMEWILFPVWAELSKEKRGLGLSQVGTGAISFLCFPLTGVFLMLFYKKTKSFKTSYVLYVTTIIMFCLMVANPLLFTIDFSSENSIMLLVGLNSIKETAFTLWISSSSLLFSKLFPGRTLGRIFSWSYLGGHTFLILLSQTYPRLMGWTIESAWIEKTFGPFKMVVFFSSLASLLLPVNILLTLAKKILFNREDVLI